MLKLNDLATREIGISEFTDTKSRTHVIKHSIVLTNTEKRELEEKIAEDLYQILTNGKK